MKLALRNAFIQCHRSYIANIAYALRQEQNELIMTTGVNIPIARRNLEKSFDIKTANTYLK